MYSNKDAIRNRSIDIARGTAIVLMMQNHLLALVPYEGLLNNITSLLSPASFFLLVSGVSYEFFFKSRLTRYSDKKIMFFEILYRALLLVFVDIMILLVGSILWPSIYSFAISWGVIEVIAFGYLFGYFFRNELKSKIFMTIGLIFLMVTLNSNILNNVTLFNLSTTLLPKLIYFQSGRIIHNLLMSESKKKYLSIISILVLICNVLIIYLFHLNIYDIGWVGINRWKFPLILIIIGNIFIFIASINKINTNTILSLFLSHIERLGKIAFTVYFVHVGLIFVTLTFILKFFPNIIIKPSFSLHFFILIVFIIFFSSVEKYWSRHEYIFGFEWIVRKGSKYMAEFTSRLVQDKQISHHLFKNT